MYERTTYDNSIIIVSSIGMSERRLQPAYTISVLSSCTYFNTSDYYKFIHSLFY